MLQYAWAALSRRSLWLIAALCAALLVVPGMVLAIVFPVPGVALLVTGDVTLAGRLMPDAATTPVGLLALVAGAMTITILWARCFAAGVWASAQDADPGLRPAFANTRRGWRRVALLYVQAHGLWIACAAVLLVGGVLAPDPVYAPYLIVAIGGLLVARTIVRVVLTVAVRAVVLDDTGTGTAWHRARALLRERRREATGLWITLIAAGITVWMAGRLVSPVVQQTAWTYPPASRHSFIRELSQALIAVPVEAFLLALSFGAWTALWRGVTNQPVKRVERKPVEPWVLRALIVLAALVVMANGTAAMVDGSFTARRNDRLGAVAGREVTIERTLRVPSTVRLRSNENRASYQVVASLDGRILNWTTTIRFSNPYGETLDSVGLNVYAAAYDRPLPDIPLAQDLRAQDLTGGFALKADPGDLAVKEVLTDGRIVSFDLSDTALRVPLTNPLSPGEAIELEIEIESRLPEFPERFGVWNGMTLLGNWVPVLARRDVSGWYFTRFGQVGEPFVSDVADYDIRIEADDSQVVAGSGTLESIDQSGTDRRTWHFEAAAVRDVAFAASPFFRVLESSVDGTVVRSWYEAEDRLTGSSNLETASSAIAYYTRHFGKLPFDEVDVVSTNGLLGGMEYPGIVFVSTATEALEGLPVIPDLLEYAGFDDAQRRYVLGHELAHQWWYASVGNDQVNEPWLDEGLAEASTITWLRSEDGDDRVWAMTNLTSVATPRKGVVGAPVTSFSSNLAYSESIYLSGAQVLLQLRDDVGEDTYDRIMQHYYDTFTNRIASIDDFVAAVRDVAGDDAAGIVEAYR